jgi:sugar phosphate isomerase/epimerase
MTVHSSISRRAFLGIAGAAPFAIRSSLFAAKDVPVGLELYSVRDALMKDLMGTVRAVGKMGYKVVEFYSPYYAWSTDQAKDVRTLLDDLGMQCRSTHNDSKSLTVEGLPKAIELNQIIGSKYIVMASPGPAKTLDDWKAVAGRLTTASDKLGAAGMAAGYHNHGMEWHAVDGQRPIDVLAANTPHDVMLQFDVGTCVEAGADPVAWIKANPGRIRSIHCKDWGAGQGRGYSVVFGEGDAPWTKIFEAAESTGGVEFYLIEQEQGPAQEQLQRAERCLANWHKMRSS